MDSAKTREQPVRLTQSPVVKTVWFRFRLGDRVRSTLDHGFEGVVTEGLAKTSRLVVYEVQTDDGRFFAAEQKDLRRTI